MKEALFYTFLGIFAITAVITILGVTQKLKIPRRYLNVLFASLLIELATAVIGLFKSTEFFPPQVQQPHVNQTPDLKDWTPGTSWMLRDKSGEWPIHLLPGGQVEFLDKRQRLRPLPAPRLNSWEVIGDAIVMKFGNGSVVHARIINNQFMTGTISNKVGDVASELTGVLMR